MSSRFLNISTDNTLGGGSASDEIVSSQKAVKEYVDSHGGSGGTYPNILSYQWSDHLFNDMSWLRSDTFSWQDGTVYETAYQHLVDDLDIRETQVITFGNPKVNPETTYTEYVATRSPKNDVISSGLYAWYDADYETLYYTQSENPTVDDRLYTVNSDPVGYVVWTVTTEDMPSVLPTIETVGSYSIVVYIAEDGHKIVLPDQEQTVEDIYDESGVAWYFILDTENQRFKLPRTKWGFVGLRDTVGNYVSESLPNIWYSNGGLTSDPTIDGALEQLARWNIQQTETTSSTRFIASCSFSATRCSGAYQDNAPVQQRATQMYLYFYVGEFSQSAIEQTAGITAETLNAKANTDLSNLTTTGKSTVAELPMPSDNYVDLSVPSDGTQYTAPANGWLVLKGTINAQVGLVGFEYLPNGIATYNWASLSGNGVASYIPVSKGQTVALRRVNIGSLSTARFYYAQGEI